jgi:hypothetical protein
MKDGAALSAATALKMLNFWTVRALLYFDGPAHRHHNSSSRFCYNHLPTSIVAQSIGGVPGSPDTVNENALLYPFYSCYKLLILCSNSPRYE